jgi:hypothetical protein
MVNGVLVALAPAVLAVMTICPVVPSSLAEGVPASAPVLVLNASQEGRPVAANDIPAPLEITLGWNKYCSPTVAVAEGLPSIVIDALGLEGAVGVAGAAGVGGAAVAPVVPVVAAVLPLPAFAVSLPLEPQQPDKNSPITSKPVNRDTVIINPLRA